YNEKISRKGDKFSFLKSGSLFVLNLKSGQQQEYRDVTNYELSENGNFLIYHSGNLLTIELLNTGKIIKLDQVKEYKVSPNQNHVVVIESYGGKTLLKLINLFNLEIKEVKIEN